jgi:hypothetical protein
LALGIIAAQDIPLAPQDVFKYDWLPHGGPAPEYFERAVRERLSNRIIQVPEEQPARSGDGNGFSCAQET